MIGGNRPVIGGNRPVIGSNRLVIGGNRPVIGGNRPVNVLHPPAGLVCRAADWIRGTVDMRRWTLGPGGRRGGDLARAFPLAGPWAAK